MDFINDALDKAKDLFSVAKQKTEEAVSVGKQKLDIASVENKIYKLNAKLGIESFSFLSEREDLPKEITDIIVQIKANKKLLAKLHEELGKTQRKRVCYKCGNTVADDSAFCDKCGEKISFEG